MTGRFAIAALLLVVLLAVGHPAEPQPSAEPPPGQLLIASAAIQDPRFQHSVVLLLRHDASGAFGLIINHPVGERSLAELLAAIDRKANPDTAGGQDNTIEGTIRVFRGGPVQPQLGFVVHSPEYRRPQTLVVGDKLAMTADKEVLRDIGHHQGPAKYLFVLGYAGWGAGQLEGEIARRSWTTAPADGKLIFDEGREKLWDIVYALRIQDL